MGRDGGGLLLKADEAALSLGSTGLLGFGGLDTEDLAGQLVTGT